MAAAKQVHEPIAGDGFGAQTGCAVERLTLDIEQHLQSAKGFVIKSFSSG
jgi:hypothetical protein